MRGIEPRLRAPEARVLPLYDIPLGALQAHPVFDSVTAESSVGPVVGRGRHLAQAAVCRWQSDASDSGGALATRPWVLLEGTLGLLLTPTLAQPHAC